MSLFIVCLIVAVSLAAHELGHFLPALLFKCKVYEYSIGVGPGFSKEYRGTKYSIRALPIMAYVNIELEDLEQLPFWKYAIILMGGITANLLLAYLAIVVIVFANGADFHPVNLLYAGQFWWDVVSTVFLETFNLLLHPVKVLSEASSVIGIVGDGAQIIDSTPNIDGVPLSGAIRLVVTAGFVTVVLNSAIAAFNLLPLPVLDGGRLLLKAVKQVFPLSEKLEFKVQFFSALLLLGAATFLSIRDIIELATR